MNCPICGGAEKKKIYRLCDNMKIMGSNFPDTPAYIAKCNTCGLLYMESDATQQDFLEYYMHGAVAPKYYDMFGNEDVDEYYDHLYDLISPYISEDSKILDIAGAWGEFAAYMMGLGYKDITDLDPSERCLENAKELGVKTIKTDSTAMDALEDASYDLIILNHSLEHILDVKSTMENIIRILKDDGYLFIEIPDAEHYVDEEAAPFNFFTYEHVLHMSMNDLENLAAQFGFEIIDKGNYYKKVSNYPSIYAVLKKGTVTGVKKSDLAEEAVNKYIKKSKASIEVFVSSLRESGEKLILWGIGASTTILLGLFEGCNVKKLIDKNPSRQGLSFGINNNTYKIEPPENVGGGTIVILSIPYHDSIERDIRRMGLKNRIVALR